MATVALTTYRDLVRHLLDFLGADPQEQARRDARRAALNAYREFASAARWVYYYQRGRFNSVAPYSTGTVTYLHSSGASARQVTLAGGTWPSWAASGTLVFNANTPFEVDALVSSTVLTLTEASNPGADVSTAQGFTLYRDTYPLPADCLAIDRLLLVNNAFCLSYEHPGVWLERQRIYKGPATPRTYTIKGDPDNFGRLGVCLFPAPDNAYAFDFVYQRRPRALLIEDVNSGVASVTSGQTTVSGSGTAWTSTMVGSVIRLSADNQNLPDAPWGLYPAAQERVVTGFTSATSLTADSAFTQSLSGVKCVVSDPVDVEEGAMLNALLRCAEKHIALQRRKEDRPAIDAAYREALILAREADSRSFALEAAGGRYVYPYRLADMPRGPDVS